MQRAARLEAKEQPFREHLRDRRGVQRVGVDADGAKPKSSPDELDALVSTRQVEVVGLKTRFAESETRNASLEETIVNLAQENELLKRRLFGNKTERTGTSELQLTLGNLLDAEKRLQKGAGRRRRQSARRR